MELSTPSIKSRPGRLADTQLSSIVDSGETSKGSEHYGFLPQHTEQDARQSRGEFTGLNSMESVMCASTCYNDHIDFTRKDVGELQRDNKWCGSLALAPEQEATDLQRVHTTPNKGGADSASTVPPGPLSTAFTLPPRKVRSLLEAGYTCLVC